MKVTNKSCKVIGIGGEPLLPGYTMELRDGLETHPSIADYLKKGILVDADKASAVESANGISDAERARIAEEAIANYKKEQEELVAAQASKQAEIKEVKNMKKKDDLLKKATAMGLDVKDDDTVDDLKAKIIEAINQ